MRSPLGSRLRRADRPRVLLAVLVVGVLLVGAVVLVALGPDLPGPGAREYLGLADDPLAPCTPGAEQVRAAPGRTAGGGRWREEPALPTARDELKAVTLGSHIYVGTGQIYRGGDEAPLESVASLWDFDASRRRYALIPDAPRSLDHAGAAAYRGELLLTGGHFDQSRSTNRMWSYSPEGRRWVEQPPMRQARGALATAVIGKRLYAVGGSLPTLDDPLRTPFPTLEVYDFATRRWTFGPDMPTPRHHLAAAALDGKLYVAGGRRPGEYSQSAFERFDPRTQEWERLPPLPQGAGGSTAVAVAGQIVVVGGGDDAERWVTPATWAYSPARGSWRRLADLRVPRHGHAAAVLGNRVYVFGGAPCPGFGRTDSVESLAVR